MRYRNFNTIVSGFLSLFLFTIQVGAAEPASAASKPAKENHVNVVLVHGLWADGTSWSKVMRILQDKGYTVVAPQLRLTSIADDIESTKRMIASLKGPTVLVGHSYGGAVITGAGIVDNCKALVYVAAYAPDQGEGLNELNAKVPPGSGGAAIRPDDKGYLWLDRELFHDAFAADVDKHEAAIMAAVQKPAFVSGLADRATVAAWKTKPAYYQISTKDNMIPPALQQMMAKQIHAVKTIELSSSHASLVSHPKEIAALIELAALSAGKN